MKSEIVTTNWEYIELPQVFETFNLGDFVIVKTQIFQVRECLKAFDLFDFIKAEVEPLKIDKVFQILNAADEIVVQLQLLELFHAIKVIDFNDVLERETEVSKIPQGLVILVIDQVFPVILDHILIDDMVVDDGWPHRFFLRINLGLRFQNLTYNLVHINKRLIFKL